MTNQLNTCEISASPIYSEGTYCDANRLNPIIEQVEERLRRRPWHGRIERWKDGSTKVKRGRPPATSQKRSCDWKRGRVAGVTENTLKSFMKLIRNTDAFENGKAAAIVLTLPREFPQDAKETKRVQQCVLQHLRRQNIKGVWVRALQGRGAVHWHIITDRMPDVDKLRLYWANLAGAGNSDHAEHGVYCKLCETVVGWSEYMARNLEPLCGASVPEWAMAGLWWGKFHVPKPKPIEVVEGTLEELEPAIEVLWDIKNAKREQLGRNRLRDYGFGFQVWGLPPATLAVVKSLALPIPEEAEPERSRIASDSAMGLEPHEISLVPWGRHYQVTCAPSVHG